MIYIAVFLIGCAFGIIIGGAYMHRHSTTQDGKEWSKRPRHIVA